MFDGRMLRVWAYNGQVPGPILRVRLGERLRVHFTNRLPEATTIHWHGVRVPNAMDGAPGVTQPPVQPGDTFVYDFVPKDAGTFWFHPHLRSSEQVERGLYGVLIVEDEKPPPFTRDLVWVLDDWRLGADDQVDPRFNTPGDLMHDGRWGNVMTVNGHLKESLEVHPGERFRLRIVNTANARVFKPNFAALDAKVIALDGMYIPRAFPPTGLELSPGNRLDLDVTIPADAAPSVVDIQDQFTRQPFRIASIRIAGDPTSVPEFDSPAHGHVPSWRGTESLEPTLSYDIDAARGGPFGISWMLNGEAYSDHAAHHGSTLRLATFAKLRFHNLTYRLHPMHIHGMFFKVLARNGAPVDEPFWRDTALVHAQETLDVGVVPLDAGQWMLHCHVLEHAEAGMMTTVEVRP